MTQCFILNISFFFTLSLKFPLKGCTYDKDKLIKVFCDHNEFSIGHTSSIILIQMQYIISLRHTVSLQINGKHLTMKKDLFLLLFENMPYRLSFLEQAGDKAHAIHDISSEYFVFQSYLLVIYRFTYSSLKISQGKLSAIYTLNNN